jgi:hypothetical protein
MECEAKWGEEKRNVDVGKLLGLCGTQRIVLGIMGGKAYSTPNYKCTHV